MKQAIKEDAPPLAICGAIFSYCTLANTAEVMQQIGIIATGAAAVVILFHRLWVFWNDAHKNK